LRPEHRRLGLVLGQHQRRQIEPALQHIADPRLTAHRHPLPDQSSDIAIDGALGGLELGRHRFRRYRAAGAAEDLHDLKKAFGPAHSVPLLPRC